MADLYVRPTRAHADVVLSGGAPIDEGVSSILDHVRTRIDLVDIETLLSQHAPK